MNVTTNNRLREKRSLRFLCLVVVAQFALMACSTEYLDSPALPDDSAFDVAPPPNFTRGLLERRSAEPLYPLRARNLGVEGWVMLGFSVNADGDVVGNSIRTIQEQPEGYFETSAVTAARRLAFQNTRGELVEDVRYVFRYQLEGLNSVAPIDTTPDIIQFREMLPQRLITPPYPEEALQSGTEGYVVVNFTVTEAGAVQDIVVAESVPTGVFDEEALRAAQRLRFEPRIVVGEAVRVEDVAFRFDWNLPR